MKKIEYKNLNIYKDILHRLSEINFENSSVFFFPVEMEEDMSQNDSGIAMFNSMAETQRGSSALIQYGIFADENGLSLGSALYDRSAVIIDMHDIVNFFEIKDFETVKELECRLLKKNSIIISKRIYSNSVSILNE